MMRWVAMVVLVGWVGAARAQDACESRCNQVQAACLRACVGPPDGSKTQGQKMHQCLRQCTQETKPCRERCAPPPPPAPRR